MQQDSESPGTTLWRSLKHRLAFQTKYQRKEESMGVYNLDEVLKTLRYTTDEVTHYATEEGGTWQVATNGCVPWNAVSFKTKQGGYWNINSGWFPWSGHKEEGNLIKPEDPKHPMNSENAHYRIPIAVLATLPEQMQKDFHIIRERVDRIVCEDRKFEAFFADVEFGLSAYGISPDEKSRKNLKAILKGSYGKFKRA